jgi:glycosyltransferase involved in cell wall biosynthesis
MTRLLIHSNAPWAPTGYGVQTGLFAPMLAEHYEVAISAFYGLEGAPIKWDGIPVLPGLGGEYGNLGTLEQHAASYFGGDPKGGLVLTLMDVWVLEPKVGRGVNMACWTPVDHEPAPPKVVEFFMQSDAVPIAMSRFGERMLGRLDPLYCPHGIPTDIYKPLDKRRVRGGAFGDDAFVAGIVAANKGRPSRKCFAQALAAFALFAADKPNARLYLHTTLDPNIGGGENIAALIESLGIPPDHIRVADQYALQHAPYSQADMAKIFSALDVLLNPSLGEGFGIPIIEAAACGVPAIVTDHSAMREVCGAGWHVKHHPYWTALNSWQAIPDVDDIASALEECYRMAPARREKLSRLARAHAVKYDARRVFKQHMLPAVRAAEQRFADREPVTIPSRSKAAA